MSLTAAAQHLAAHGRGPDTTLVHMSHGEVKSLQDLARAHGGSLSINPHTGLPEAGFLSNILPMVAGAALNAFVPGLGAMGAGLLTGAVTGIATGNMGKGLMAGLGAYGGAGLMGGLTGAGAAAADAAAMQGSGATIMPGAMTGGAPIATPASPLQNAWEGIKGLGTEAGRDSFMSNIGGTKELLKYGAAAAAPSVMEAMKEKPPETPAADKDMGQRYVYEPNKLQGPYTASSTGAEQQYFTPSYRKISAADAKSIYGYADGGEVPAPGTPTQYSYDPTAQSYAKIEPPSEKKAQAEAYGPQQGGGHATPMSDEAFAAQQAQGEANAQALGTTGEAISKGLLGLLTQPPMAVQIAQSVLGSLGLTGNASGFGAPGATSGNAGAMGTGAHGMAAGATSGGTSSGLSGLSGVGTSSGAGFGAPGATSGNAGALGFGASGMAAGASPGGGAANGGLMAAGGVSHLGDYSDGGRLLRGPGDGVSDSIPAMIGKKQPARLADGEFVVPARIVSELGNGSTEAGARKLYAMMDRVQKARGSTTGKGRVAKNSRAEQYLPA